MNSIIDCITNEKSSKNKQTKLNDEYFKNELQNLIKVFNNNIFLKINFK
jgi:hypothetical protein